MLALAQIIRNREAYKPQISTKTPVLQLAASDILGKEESGEEQAARGIAKSILACYELSDEEALALVQKGGIDWDQPDTRVFSTDRLRDFLAEER